MKCPTGYTQEAHTGGLCNCGTNEHVQAFLKAQDAFVNAAGRLLVAWEQLEQRMPRHVDDLTATSYPPGMKSFVGELLTWREASKDAAKKVR